MGKWLYVGKVQLSCFIPRKMTEVVRCCLFVKDNLQWYLLSTSIIFWWKSQKRTIRQLSLKECVCVCIVICFLVVRGGVVVPGWSGEQESRGRGCLGREHLGEARAPLSLLPFLPPSMASQLTQSRPSAELSLGAFGNKNKVHS